MATMTSSAALPDELVERSWRLLEDLLCDAPVRRFAVRFWDGRLWQIEPMPDPEFTLVLRHAGTLPEMFQGPNMLSLAEAFMSGQFDIEGDIVEAVRLGEFLLAQRRGWLQRVRLGWRLRSLRSPPPRSDGPAGATLRGRSMSRERVHGAVTYHYELPVDFFKLWLDRQLVYSGAYFHTSVDSLEAAQVQKLEHVCGKLQLRSGERLMDLGCGWGALVCHAARRFGVTACGVTVSRQQMEFGRQRIEEAGLQHLCSVETHDFRDATGAPYDKVASIGMAEHVRRRSLPEYYRTVLRLLRPGGLFLSQCIACSEWKRLRSGPSFMDRHVFPDTELVPLHVTLRAAEQAGFEVRDVENLRQHYALTLERWLRRLESSEREAVQLVGDATYRKFRLYLAACAHDFQVGRLNLFQVLCSKPASGSCELPLTRSQWYSPTNP